MEKQWKLKNDYEQATVDLFVKELKLTPIIAKLLVQRKITTKEQAYNFFNPQLSNLYDPFLMKDMDKAISRIEKAIENNEKVIIYGDYDVDGTTAVAVAYSFLKKLNLSLDYYIPDRYIDGYGLSKRGIDYAHRNGFTLMITLDCGIKANEEVEYAKTKGIDIIIGDHHRPGDILPDACAVLDPKRLDCEYPYKDLSGCGVGFKLIQAYARKHKLSEEENIYPLLDLVAISIASDIVPITDENRILAYYGLQQINRQPRPGIEAILRYSPNVTKNSNQSSPLYFSKELTINDMVFLVGPRINAAGRIESGRNSVNLLLSQDQSNAVLMGEKINELNKERKHLDQQATVEALAFIKINESSSNRNTTVVYDPSWSKGVIGIVASRLTETYYRPTIVFTESNGLLTGSARSVKGFDIYDAIEACSDLLEHFGGHKYAAGLSIKPSDFESFRDRFEKNVKETLQGKILIPEIEIDCEIPLSEVNLELLKQLKRFAPFGPGNMNPIFSSQNVKDTGSARIVGSNNHLKLSVIQAESRSFPINSIAFQLGQHCDKIQKGRLFSICYHIEENTWNGATNLQLNIKDIKFPS